MRLFAGLAIGVCVLGASHAGAAEQPPDMSALASIDDTTFDAQFRCPETLASDDERIDEYQRYLAWSRVHHADWSFKKRIDVRYGLLRRHGCVQTLRNAGSSAMPAFGP